MIVWCMLHIAVISLDEQARFVFFSCELIVHLIAFQAAASLESSSEIIPQHDRNHPVRSN